MKKLILFICIFLFTSNAYCGWGSKPAIYTTCKTEEKTETNAVEENDDFPKVTIRGDKLYAGDEELLLKAIGYAGIRPGKDEKDPVPEKDVGYDLVDLDMKRIKDAGFNTIRMWGLHDEKIIELAAKYKLMVVGGIWTSRIIDIKSKPKLEQAKEHVAQQAKRYSKYPNVVMLTILNEPEPGTILDVNKTDLLAYFDSLVKAAHENCPDVPVTFSNWPIAGFIESSSWDVVSYNLYSMASIRFKEVIDFYDYINGLKQLKSPDKPFFLSEYGMYAPVPKLNPKDIWKFQYVKNEDEQAKKFIEDLEIISQTNISGYTTMQYMDIWFISRDFSSPEIPLFPPSENKKIHDQVCIEWGGLVGMDEKYEGIPRKAYYASKKANMGILRKPDTRKLYDKELPIRIHLEKQVAEVKAIIDGNLIQTIPRVSRSWAELNIPVKSFSTVDKIIKHTLEVKLFDNRKKIINTLKRTFFTGPKIDLPNIEITHNLDKMDWPSFIIKLTDVSGEPVPDVKLDLAFLNAFTWKDAVISTTTDKDGIAVVVSPDYGPLLMGVRYQYKNGDYKTNSTKLYYYKK
ncbi:MAG: hypothetical protein KAI43_02275 [Candidatus Aureabacteria bacterium]|nr:hypothetical protein [Candidatus Auribacterota bacterium]